MDPIRRALAMVGIFVGLLGFHGWLLYRMLNTANWLLAGLLVLAIGLFGWRIHHYANLYRSAKAGPSGKGPAEERRQIRIMIPVLAALLALHTWLIFLTLAWPDSVEKFAFLILLLLAVSIFVARLGFYAWLHVRLKGS